jgi:Carboxypeptidase regulatory-like domain
MRRLLHLLLFVVCASVLSCASLWAQATAQINGTAQDQSGAVLPGVEITATQTETGATRMTVTNESGSYSLPNLPLGPYKLEAGLPGFRTFVQTGIVLQVGANPTINVVLQVGQVSEQVEVQANASLVETRNVSVGQVMETARIMELPLNGRNAQELLLLGGGAVQTAPVGGMSFPGRLTISSAGSLGTATEYTLDGIRHVDPYDGVPLPLPFPDALAEFKTEIGGANAQQGRSSQVSAVTKSGTNQFHGDLFEFVRNDLFNARSYFATKSSSLKRHQFGGTAGGPIIKNRLFFFGGYQGTTLRQDPRDTRQFVPTAAMLAGDFTAFAAPACNAGRTITLRAPFVNNRVDPAQFSPVAMKIAAHLPKTNDPCGEVTFGRRDVDNQHQFVGKIDYQSSAKHSIFGRFMLSTDHAPSPFEFTPDIPMNADNSSDARAYAFTAGSTYLISSTTVNALRIAFTRNHLLTESPEYFSLQELGSNVYSGYVPKRSKITITSGFTLPGNGKRNFGIDFYQISDDLSLTRGTHQFNFGGRIGNSRTNVALQTNMSPNFNFSGAVIGLGLADFLLGRASDFNQGTSIDIFTRVKYLSLYAQDTWQAKPRVNVTYGLRWAPILPQVDVHRPVPYVLNWDPAKYRQGVRSTVFVNAPPGILFPGDAGFVQNNNGANAANPRADIWNPYWKDFAPRVGVAWDVQGNGRTSVRASYGINYNDYPTVDRLGSQSAMPPYGSLTRVITPAGGLDNPWAGIPGGNPFPFVINQNMPFVPFGEYLIGNPDLTPTYDQSWNLSIQREIVSGTLLSASYIGTKITHLQAADPLNMAIFVPGNGDASGTCFLNGRVTHFKVAAGTPCSTVGNTQDRRVLTFANPAFGNEIGRLATVVNGGNQSYNGLLLSIQHRPARSINVSGNYTWSHCVGDYQARSNNGFGASVDHTYQDPTNRSRDRGNCEIDQRQAFNLTSVAQTPEFANHIVNMLGSGWRLSGIYRLSSSGTIVATSQSSGNRTVTLGSASGSNASATTSAAADRCLCDISGQRPNQVLENVYLDKSGRPNTQYLNPVAFAPPALGTLGSLGRTTLKLPPAWQFDVALARTFRVREAQTLEFRAEAYNVLNSFRVGVPPGSANSAQAIDTNLSSSQFGKVRLALEPRILQFALKYLF